jgi:hypothetical protein
MMALVSISGHACTGTTILIRGTGPPGLSSSQVKRLYSTRKTPSAPQWLNLPERWDVAIMAAQIQLLRLRLEFLLRRYHGTHKPRAVSGG